MTGFVDDLWAELTGDDWDDAEDGDAGEVIGEEDREAAVKLVHG